jgi:hypothetical protein
MDIKKRWTPETIKVYPVDKDKLSAELNEEIHRQHPEIPVTKIFSVRSHQAIIREPKLCLIDDEFYGFEVKDNKIGFEIYWEEKIDDNRREAGCFPAYEVNLKLADLEDYLLPPVTLAEHTKERRNYNARIQRNEYEWIKALNR